MKKIILLVVFLLLSSLILSSAVGTRIVDHTSKGESISGSPVLHLTPKSVDHQLSKFERNHIKLDNSRYLKISVESNGSNGSKGSSQPAAGSHSITTSGSCMKKNPFMEMFGQQLAVTGEPERSTSPICSTQWSTSMTCCKANAVSEHIKNDQKKLDEASNSLIKVINKMAKQANEIEQYGLSQDSKVAFLTVYNDQLQGETLEQSAMKCTNYMKQARSSAICYLCAGDSTKYYMGDKIKISKDNCNSMLSNCARLIKAVIVTIDGINSLEDVVNTIQNAEKKGLYSEVVKLAKDLHKLSSSSNIMELLHNYNHLAVSNDLHTDAMSGLCGIFFSLTKKTFYEDFRCLFESIVDFAGDIVMMQKRMNGENAGKGKGKDKGTVSSQGASEGVALGLNYNAQNTGYSRKLISSTSLAPSTDPFISDVTMMKTPFSAVCTVKSK